MTVRTRLAPSPTGDPHVGTAYQRCSESCGPLRIAGASYSGSRTPTGRGPRPRHETAIMDCLRWLGLDWDEGPDVGGPAGLTGRARGCTSTGATWTCCWRWATLPLLLHQGEAGDGQTGTGGPG